MFTRINFMIYVCIIGVSGYGNVHYNLLLDFVREGKACAAAAAIINQDEEAEKCETLRSMGCEIFSDYREMFDVFSGKADLCMIPTGIPLHRPMTVAALEAGMNVFVEKPVAGTVQDVRAMINAENKSGKTGAVGFQFMYSECTMKTKQEILNGAVGNIESLACRVLWPRGMDYYSRNGWAGKLKSGDDWILDSPFNNAMAHYLMQMLFFAGGTEIECAKPVSVEAELYRVKEIESPDTACIRVETERGIPILFYVTHACTETIHPELRISGSKGELLWGNEGTSLSAGGNTEPLCAQDYQSSRNRMFDSIIGIAEGRDDFVCTLEAALYHTLCVNGAHESSSIHTLGDREQSGDTHVIPGVGDIIDAAFREKKLFSETGVEWAQPGELFSLEGYTEFNGGKI